MVISLWSGFRGSFKGKRWGQWRVNSSNQKQVSNYFVVIRIPRVIQRQAKELEPSQPTADFFRHDSLGNDLGHPAAGRHPEVTETAGRAAAAPAVQPPGEQPSDGRRRVHPQTHGREPKGRCQEHRFACLACVLLMKWQRTKRSVTGTPLRLSCLFYSWNEYSEIPRMKDFPPFTAFSHS